MMQPADWPRVVIYTDSAGKATRVVWTCPHGNEVELPLTEFTVEGKVADQANQIVGRVTLLARVEIR